MLAERIHSPAVLRFTDRSGSRQSTRLDRWALARLQKLVEGAPIRFVLWDGFALQPPDREPVASIVFRNRRALVGWLLDPELNFGETYMCGAVEIRGDLHALLTEIYRALPQSIRVARHRERHDLDASRDHVHAHYDLGNDFYRLWLDEQMLYTCAFFPDRASTLEQAQVAKMDRVCRKLWLRPGDTVVEAGCGWGSLALHMARCYGVRVLACNVSHAQIAYARERARAEGLEDRVDFVEDDYRALSGRFDVFVSVGMLEHVGLDHYDMLGTVIDRVLAPDGRGLLHFIGRDRPEPLNAWIRRRIFPGAYPPALHEVCEQLFAPAWLSVLDIENLRQHYAVTLEHWRRRFEERVAGISTMFDDRFVRAWRLYLTGSQVAFETGTMQLFQVVFARRGSNAIPWVRNF
jgi:cyclopropane-fatty-acyl-phospholipid synthase